jgi:hypothetical protein
MPLLKIEIGSHFYYVITTTINQPRQLPKSNEPFLLRLLV